MTAPYQWMGTCFRGLEKSNNLNVALQKLYIVGSYDGYDWWPLGTQPAYDDNNCIRDPTFLWSNASGTWTCFVAYTFLNSAYANVAFSETFMQGTSFGIVKSTDLVTWTHVAYIDCSAAQTTTGAVPNSYDSPTTWGTTTHTTTITNGTSFSTVPCAALLFSIAASTAIVLGNGQTVTTQNAVTPAGATTITLAHSFTAAGTCTNGSTITSPNGVYSFGTPVVFGGISYICTANGGTGFSPTSDTAHWAKRVAAWGPQWFVDPVSGNTYVFMQISVKDIWAYKATDTTGFTTFDTGTRVITNNAGGFPSTNYATFVLYDAPSTTYHMWANSLTLGGGGQQGMWHATSASLLSGYTVFNNSVAVPELTNIEGPYIVFDGSQYRLYADDFGETGSLVYTAAALNGSWTLGTLTVSGGLTQSSSNSLFDMHEGALGGALGITGATGPYGTWLNATALAALQALSTYPPRSGVRALH